jgi:hypothetical protein
MKSIKGAEMGSPVAKRKDRDGMGLFIITKYQVPGRKKKKKKEKKKKEKKRE